MPIRWNPARVSEAADMIEEYVKQAAEPLEQARIVAKEARKIANLPLYVDQHIVSVLSEIERVTGGEHSFGNHEHYEGSIKRSIARLRDSLPKEALEVVKTREREQPSLLI